MAAVSGLTSFSFVRMCQIDGMEGTENLVMIRLLLQEISRKTRGGGQNIAHPLQSRVEDVFRNTFFFFTAGHGRQNW